MKSLRRLPIVLFALLAWGQVPAGSFDADRYLEHIKYLASEELQGRGTGSEGLEKAAAYISGQFDAIGLETFSNPGRLQPFPVTINAGLGTGNGLSVTHDGRTRTLRLGRDYTPLQFSSSGEFEAGVVFAGYGITANEYDYDDYAGIDVKDKFVVVMRHEPQEFDDDSVFSGKIYTEHSQFFSKASNAKMHGAKGVIFVNDAWRHEGKDNLEPFSKNVGPQDAGIPFLQMIAADFEKLLPAGQTLKQIEEGIDRGLMPESFVLPEDIRIQVSVDIRREDRTTHNVLGYLPGETDEYVIVGAHYDHLGLGEEFSLAPKLAGTPHLGADDNASGASGVIELARYFASQPKMRRGVLFMTFAGEELGLLGSSFYVNNPELPVEKAVTMINLDMIGRIRDSKLYIGGLGTGSTLRPIVEQVDAESRLSFETAGQGGYGSSDHTSFTTKQIPVLFFFSGLHSDYHKPSDTWDKINAPRSAEALAAIAGVITELAQRPDRPEFVRVSAAPNPHGAAAAGDTGSGGGGGYGPYFGSIPDFAEPPTGVRFADVREGSPAGKAGLRAGDILVEYDGKPIGNLYDFTYALRSSEAGQTVPVKVLRDGAEVLADVTLEERQ